MKPFHGLIFCPTGLDPDDIGKDISKKIIKLGGHYSRDLTKQVHVLILGNSNLQTNKYKFAVKHRNDIIFIRYTTIDKLYQLWVSGNDISYQSHSNFKQFSNNQPLRMLHVLRTRFSAKPLTNFYIFIGRIDNNNGNNDIISQLEALCHEQNCFKCNSTQFIKDVYLTNPDKHILFITDNSDSLRAEAAQDVGIPLVHYKWILDCNKRNATLEFDPYYLVENTINVPYEKIGSDACESLLQVINVPKSLQPQNQEEQTKIYNINNKFKPQGEKLWQKALDINKSNVISEIPIQESLTTTTTKTNTKIIDKKNKPINEHKIFSNYTFSIHKEFPLKHYQILEKVITQNEGIISNDSSVVNYLIIPSNIPVDKLSITNSQNSTLLVTDFFIERCLHYNKLIDPIDSWSKPFYYTENFNIIPKKQILHNNDNLIHISITGFYGVELLHLTKMLQILKPMGVEFSEYLNSKTDVLLLNIASLSSIPTTHILWKNEYGDLLRENLDQYNTPEQNSDKLNIKKSPVFRNSMKKKIEFVKNSHSIPVVTPAFLIEIFRNTRSLNQYTTKIPTVHLNNKSWCVLCPKGSKDGFCCQLAYMDHSMSSEKIPLIKVETDKPELKTHSPSRPSSAFSSVKLSVREVVNTIHKSSTVQRHQIRKRVASIEKDDKDQPDILSVQSLPETYAPEIKRTKISHIKKIRPISRSSSWGTIISNEMEKNPNNEKEIPDNIEVPETIQENIGYTQVSYGHNGQKTEDSNTYKGRPVKRLTRHHTKELGI